MIGEAWELVRKYLWIGLVYGPFRQRQAGIYYSSQLICESFVADEIETLIPAIVQ